MKGYNVLKYEGSSTSTVKPVYNDDPWDLKIVAVVDRWSLLRGHLTNSNSK